MVVVVVAFLVGFDGGGKGVGTVLGLVDEVSAAAFFVAVTAEGVGVFAHDSFLPSSSEGKEKRKGFDGGAFWLD